MVKKLVDKFANHLGVNSSDNIDYLKNLCKDLGNLHDALPNLRSGDKEAISLHMNYSASKGHEFSNEVKFLEGSLNRMFAPFKHSINQAHSEISCLTEMLDINNSILAKMSLEPNLSEKEMSFRDRLENENIEISIKLSKVRSFVGHASHMLESYNNIPSRMLAHSIAHGSLDFDFAHLHDDFHSVVANKHPSQIISEANDVASKIDSELKSLNNVSRMDDFDAHAKVAAKNLKAAVLTSALLIEAMTPALHHDE